MKFALYKELGQYKLTKYDNYKQMFMNERLTIVLNNCDNYKQAYDCAIANGFKPSQIVNETGENY